ncbi:MAG TPA: phosphoesterase, partial [Acidimicrobiia bacterium]|nr:phosphoesterase [Acidimicrobiia bacterium]
MAAAPTGKTATSSATGSTAANATSKITHVAVINLENKTYGTTFGPSSTAPYLSQTLTKQGDLLSQYYGV